MEIQEIITSNPYLIFLILFVIAGVIINLFVSSAKKTGEVAVKGSTSALMSIFKLIKKIFIFIISIFHLGFLLLALIMAYIFKKK